MDWGSEQPTEILQTLERIVGATGLLAAATTELFSPEGLQGTIAPGATTAAIVSPATPAELADLVTTTHHQHWPLLPYGNGSKLNWGGLVGSGIGGQGSGVGDRQAKIQNPKSKIQNHPRPLILLSTRRLNRLIEHAVGDLTVTVEAGMKFAELQGILAKEGQFLA